MRKIPLNNQTILNKLDELHQFRQPEVLNEFVQTGEKFTVKEKDWFTSDEYFDKIRGMKRNHDGFPEAIKSTSLQYSTMKPKTGGNPKLRQETYRKLTLDRPVTYQIKVPGLFGDQWSDWNGGMTISVKSDGDNLPTTTLTAVLDQAALQGLLCRLYSMGLPLISVFCVDCY